MHQDCIFRLTPDQYAAYHPAPITSCGSLKQVMKSLFGKVPNCKGRSETLLILSLKTKSTVDRNMGGIENDATSGKS